MPSCGSAMSCRVSQRWFCFRDRCRPRHRRALGKQRDQPVGARRGDRCVDLRQRTDIDHREPPARRRLLMLLAPTPQAPASSRCHSVLACPAARREARPGGRRNCAAACRARPAPANRPCGVRHGDMAKQAGAAIDRDAVWPQQRVEPGRVSAQAGCALHPATLVSPSARQPVFERRPRDRPRAELGIEPPATVAATRWRSRGAGRPVRRTCRRSAARQCRPRRHRRKRLLARADIHEGLVDDEQPALAAQDRRRDRASRFARDDPPVRVVRIDHDGKVGVGQCIEIAVSIASCPASAAARRCSA